MRGQETFATDGCARNTLHHAGGLLARVRVAVALANVVGGGDLLESLLRQVVSRNPPQRVRLDSVTGSVDRDVQRQVVASGGVDLELYGADDPLAPVHSQGLREEQTSLLPVSADGCCRSVKRSCAVNLRLTVRPGG